jgi:uncharacterized protein (UPF0335 family)
MNERIERIEKLSNEGKKLNEEMNKKMDELKNLLTNKQSNV